VLFEGDGDSESYDPSEPNAALIFTVNHRAASSLTSIAARPLPPPDAMYLSVVAMIVGAPFKSSPHASSQSISAIASVIGARTASAFAFVTVGAWYLRVARLALAGERARNCVVVDFGALARADVRRAGMARSSVRLGGTF
jgi:hypothetical protein